MPFIGIIAKESESNFIKNEVLKNSVKNKFEFININRKSIQNIKNIRFETVVINDDITTFLDLSKYLEEIITNAKFLIINSDVIKQIEVISEYNTNIITYGLNQNAMITISSIKNEDILICIQKNIRDIYGKLIEQQDINIQIEKSSSKKICNSLAIFAILVIFGENLKKI